MTYRAARRQLDGRGTRGALVQHYAHHLGDHIAGAAHDHRVAYAHVLAAYLVDVVQGHIAHRHPAHEHRLESRDRGERPGTPDLEADVPDDREHLIGRELVRDRPARRARDEPEPLLVGARVELVDDAVDLVRQRAAPLADMAVVAEASLHPLHGARFRRYRQPVRTQQLEQLALPRGQEHALDDADPVEESAERATRRDARIELPEAPRRRVARVHEHLLAALARELVHPLEAGDRHEHLAPRLEERRRRHTPQPLWHGTDSAHVRRHVLAGNAITAGRGALEQAAAIDHAHGEPIEFRLRDVIELAVALEPLVDAPVEGTQVLVGAGIVER